MTPDLSYIQLICKEGGRCSISNQYIEGIKTTRYQGDDKINIKIYHEETKKRPVGIHVFIA